MECQVVCGLFCGKTNKTVPLESISTTAEIRGFIAETTSTLLYKNSTTDHIEAVFTFPVNDSSAVYKFEAELDGRTIISEVQEKEQAKETYDDAIAAGHTATLLEESDSSGDIFRCKIGNLGPSSQAKLTIAMVTELDLTTDGAVTFTLPSVLCPRYNPRSEDGGIPRPPKMPFVPIASVPYSFNFAATIESSDTILDVKSSKDPIKCEFVDDKKNLAKISLESRFVPDHDLSFEVYFSSPYTSKVFVEKGDKGKGGILRKDMAMINFFPKINEDGYSASQEFIFVIDRSGSMGGDRIESAKTTLLLLLKSMPVGCYFNVISFGSNFEALFPEGSKEYGQESLARAYELQKTMDANFGGTEILRPLKDIYSKAPKTTHARKIFLLTDGQVSNTHEVINLVEQHSNSTRVFAFGIGEGVSTSLIKGVARAGRGKAEFVTGKDRLQAKVMKTMKASMQASVSELSVSCQNDGKLTLIPQTMPRIFFGDKLMVFAMWPETETIENKTITLKGKIGDRPFENSTNAFSSVVDNGTFAIHRLAAKTQIKELEVKESDENKSMIILLSTTANIISKYTSMVGIDKENKKKIGNLIHCDIPMPEPPMRMCAMAACAPPRLMMAQKKAKGAPRPRMAPRMMARAPVGRITVTQDCNFESGIAMCADDDDAYDDDAKMMLCGSAGDNICERMETTCPPAVQETPPDYMDLVVQQTFNGSWLLDQKLASLLKKDIKALQTAAPVKSQEVWGTILAMVFLEVNFLDQKEEWEMVALKAEQWLATQQAALEGKQISALKALAQNLALKLV